MSKHTPGPWKAADRSHVYAATDMHLVAVAQHSQSCEANARLIAAAPNLAFQLRAAANYIDALGGVSKSYRQALAAATGEQA